jgi:hypothetical protein
MRQVSLLDGGVVLPQPRRTSNGSIARQRTGRYFTPSLRRTPNNAAAGPAFLPTATKHAKSRPRTHACVYRPRAKTFGTLVDDIMLF